MSDVRLVEVPTDGYQAAEWLRVRHVWLAQLVSRIAGDSDNWLDEIAEAIAIDGPAHASAWVEYERTHRRTDFDVDEGGYYAWEDAGPANTSRGRAFAVMSGGEQ